jgi:hypothetical protein
MTSPTTAEAEVPDRLAAARRSLAGHKWQHAFDAFTSADAEQPLGGDDLEALSEAALAAARRAPDDGFREVELRGISAPVGVATVRWS